MPELPEVETIIRALRKEIKNRIILKVIVYNGNLRYPVAEDLAFTVENQPVLEVERRSKYIILELEKGKLIMHLGLTGQLEILPYEKKIARETCLEIVFKDKILRFNDYRRFGLCLFYPFANSTHPLLKNLGIEPLSDELTPQNLFLQTEKRKMNIKSFLLANRFVVGIGNIYASEILFASKIHPSKSANTLDFNQCRSLTEAIKKILHLAINEGGCSIKDYRNLYGERGNFQNLLRVYMRDRKGCYICKTAIEKIMQNGRSTYYCSQCQLL